MTTEDKITDEQQIDNYRDCDGRLWVRHDNGRYFAICNMGGVRHWIDSSLSNLRKEFGPLTPTTDYYGEAAGERS